MISLTRCSCFICPVLVHHGGIHDVGSCQSGVMEQVKKDKGVVLATGIMMEEHDKFVVINHTSQPIHPPSATRF